MKKRNLIIGRLGEELASRYLIKNNYKIIERNFRTSFAEMDILAMKDDLLIVIEVKTRKDDSITFASNSINYKKQYNLRKIANYYIMENKLYDYNIRFDIIECYWKLKKINHIKNAF